MRIGWYPFFRQTHILHGSFRILKWRYCTISSQIFGACPLTKPLGLTIWLGTSNKSVKWPLIYLLYPLYPMFSHDFPMIFPWFPYDFPMIFPWFPSVYPPKSFVASPTSGPDPGAACDGGGTFAAGGPALVTGGLGYPTLAARRLRWFKRGWRKL